jgi:hypothetical protein
MRKSNYVINLKKDGKGFKKDKGQRLTILGQIVSPDELNDYAVPPGTGVLNKITGEIWIFTGDSWVNCGIIKGKKYWFRSDFSCVYLNLIEF